MTVVRNASATARRKGSRVRIHSDRIALHHRRCVQIIMCIAIPDCEVIDVGSL
jgi:hypothetical protein